MQFKTRRGFAYFMLFYIVATAILFYGVYHFMENDQGWLALACALIWFFWTGLRGDGSGSVGSSDSCAVEDELDPFEPGSMAWWDRVGQSSTDDD